jgi:hypothetical protein
MLYIVLGSGHGRVIEKERSRKNGRAADPVGLLYAAPYLIVM